MHFITLWHTKEIVCPKCGGLVTRAFMPTQPSISMVEKPDGTPLTWSMGLLTHCQLGLLRFNATVDRALACDPVKLRRLSLNLAHIKALGPLFFLMVELAR